MSIDVQTEIRNTCLYKGGPFAVLMAMADCANTASGEGIYPGIDLLAANARLEIRATQDNIKRLRADLVVVLVGPDGDDLGPDVQPIGGRGRKTEYRIDLQRVHELQGLHEAEAGVCQFCEAREKRRMLRAGKGAFSRTKGAEIPTKGAVSDVKGAISDAHIRTHEPSVEPSGEPAAASPPASQKIVVALPSWLPKEVWDGFVEMRKKIRHPLTPRAMTLLIGELEKLRADGHDAIAIINESTMKSWRGFFAPKQEGKHAGNSKTTGSGTNHQRHRDGWAAVLDAENGGPTPPARSGQLALEPPTARRSG